MQNAGTEQFHNILDERLPIGSQRKVALDILRLFAVVLVLGRHFLPLAAWYQRRASSLDGSTWARSGVDLFFVLNGFLIAGLLFREYDAAGEFYLERFFIRRGLKICPAFYAMLFASLIGTCRSREAHTCRRDCGVRCYSFRTIQRASGITLGRWPQP
jgi:peptidoglycan/LPS O-acetylase OafA/YrhL